MTKKKPGVIRTVAALFALLTIVTAGMQPPGFCKGDLTYSQLRDLIKQGKAAEIQNVIVTVDSNAVAVRMVGADHDQSLLVPPETRQKFINNLDDAGVNIEVRDADKSQVWFSMLSSFFLPILLLVGFLFMFRSAQVPRKQ